MKKGLLIIAAFIMLASVSSCVKENYDAPPTGGKDPDIAVTTRIDSLKAQYTGNPMQITQDIVISGIVVADDKSGNFYKTIVIQDSTAGIAIKLDGNSLYTDYPIGRRLFIKCKGLWMGDYNGLIQLGGYLDAAGDIADIPSVSFEKYILKGSYFHPVAPKAVSISQLNNSLQNMLIELNGVEFSFADAGKPWADGYSKSSVNRTLKNCSGGTVIVRTSGFASFAYALTPTGKGKLIAIYSVYGNDKQLLIRDPAELKMDSTRCGGGGGGVGIAGIAALYGGSDLTIPAGRTFSAVVIADKTTSNINSSNMAVQDSTGGIIVRFTSSALNTYVVGDVITVDPTGLTLTSFNGIVQISNVPASAVTKTGTITPVARVVTVAELKANPLLYVSTLVTIQNATITGGSTYYSGTGSGATRTITDATGTIDLYTLKAATFGGTTIPSGQRSVTGYVSLFNDNPQLMLRSANDVQ